MRVPPGVLQVGLALKRKHKADEYESVDEILAAEAKQEQRSKTTAVRKPRQAKSLKRTVTHEQAPEPPTVIVCNIPDGLEVEPEMVITAVDPPPEPVHAASEQSPEPPIIIKPFCPVTYGLDGLEVEPEMVIASAELPPEPEYHENMRRRPLREAPRVPLVELCQELVRQHGPLTIDEMIMEIWGINAVGTDDARWLKAQLCKWLTAAAKESGDQFYPKRHRNPARPNARLHR